MLDAVEEAFHQVAVFIQVTIIGPLLLAVRHWRDYHQSASRTNVRDQGIGVVCLVGHHRLSVQSLDQGLSLLDVRLLATGQIAAQRIAQCIDRGMDLGAQSSARASKRLRAVFFWAPAACWWARTM